MLTLDLFGLMDAFCVSSTILLDFIERLYAPYHYTTLEREIKVQESMAKMMVNDFYKDTQLFRMLILVLEYHLSIKEESLVNTRLYTIREDKETKKKTRVLFDPEQIYKKYQKIDKLIKEMHTFIMIRFLTQKDFNDCIQTDEQMFCKIYSLSSDDFHQNFKPFKLLLEYEQIVTLKYEVHFQGFAIAKGIELRKQQTQRLEEIANLLQDFKGFKKIACLINLHPTKGVPKLEEIDLLKFKAIQHFLKRYRFDPLKYYDDLKKLAILLSLHLFSQQNLKSDYEQLQAVLNTSIESLQAKLKDRIFLNNKNNAPILFFKEENIGDAHKEIKKLFNKINLRIAGHVCSTWKKLEIQKKQNKNKIVLIGRTGVGKSSFLNFLAQKHIARTASTTDSTTFSPESYQIPELGDWEIYDMPGLEDNRKFIYRLCMCFFLNYIIKQSSQIKFVYLDQTSVWNADKFKEFVRIFGFIFRGNEQCIKSLHIVYSKVASTEAGQALEDILLLARSEDQLANISAKLNQLNLPQEIIQRFYNRFIQSVKQSYSFFTRTNYKQNNTLTALLSPQQVAANSENRKQIYSKINSISPTSNLNFNPIMLLKANDLNKIDYVVKQVIEDAKMYLQGKDTGYKHFIELFDIIEVFKKINKKDLQDTSERMKEKLQNEYVSIFKHYIQLSSTQKDKLKKQQIFKIIKTHISSTYFKPWKQVLHSEIEILLHNDQRMTQVIYKEMCIKLQDLQEYSNSIQLLKQKIQLETESHLQAKEKYQQMIVSLQETEQEQAKMSNFNMFLTNLPETDLNEQLIQRLRRTFSLFMKRIRNPQFLLNYLLFLIKAVQDNLGIQKINQKQRDLMKQNDIFIKNEYKWWITKENSDTQYIMNNIINNELDTLQRVFFNILTHYKKDVISKQLLSWVQYYLELRARRNYESKHSLQDKASKILNGVSLNVNKTWRLNCYGECYCHEDVMLSEILNLNSKKQGSCYTFLHHKNVRIYCNKITFDLASLYIKCQSSFRIIAKQILLLPSTRYTIEVSTSKGLATNVIILSQNKEIKEALRKAFIYNFCLKLRTQSVIVSRTRISEGQYLERYEQIPKFTYIIKQEEEHLKKKKYLKRNYTTQKLFQFGELHLRKMFIRELDPLIKRFDIEQFQPSKTEFCRQIIDFLIKQFANTSIKLRYELFSTSFCKKIAQLISSLQKSKEPLDQKTRKKHFGLACYQMMKDHLQSHLYQYIILKSTLETGIGRHNTYASIKSIQSIKNYCQNLLSMSLPLFQSRFREQEKLSAFTKKFIEDFETQILFPAQKTWNYFQKIMGHVKKFIHNISGEKNANENVQQVTFIEQEVKIQIQRRRNFQNEVSLFEFKQFKEQPKEKQFFRFSYPSSPQNQISKDSVATNEQNDNKIFQNGLGDLKKSVKRKIQSAQFSVVLKQYQENLGMYTIFSDKFDDIHSEIGYAYLKTLQFSKAESSFSLLPSSIAFSNKYKILHDVIKLKYKDKESAEDVKKEYYTSLVEQITTNYFRQPFDHYQSKAQSKDSYLVESMKKRENRNQMIYNILSFDSSKYQEDVINVVFAAEIEKCTHRPIMHLFDSIICKNSSAFIASRLVLPALKEGSEKIYINEYYPRYRAFEIIPNCTKQSQSLEDNPKLKNLFHHLKIDALMNDLIFVKENKKMKNIITRRNWKDLKIYKENQSPKHATLFDILEITVQQRGQQANSDPLLDAYQKEYLPILFKQPLPQINILSLGTCRTSKSVQNYPENTLVKTWKHYNRWQVNLDRKADVEKCSVQVCIEHARIFLQQQWTWNTKDMRQLFDRLEDRPSKDMLLQ